MQDEANKYTSFVSKLCTQKARTDKTAQLSDSLVITSLFCIPLQAVKKQNIVYLGRGSVTNALPVFAARSLLK
jgi:hypothetical protein